MNAVLPVTISKKYMPELIGNTKNVFATQMHWISMISSWRLFSYCRITRKSWTITKTVSAILWSMSIRILTQLNLSLYACWLTLPEKMADASRICVLSVTMTSLSTNSVVPIYIISWTLRPNILTLKWSSWRKTIEAPKIFWMRQTLWSVITPCVRIKRFGQTRKKVIRSILRNMVMNTKKRRLLPTVSLTLYRPAKQTTRTLPFCIVRMHSLVYWRKNWWRPISHIVLSVR